MRFIWLFITFSFIFIGSQAFFNPQPDPPGRSYKAVSQPIDPIIPFDPSESEPLP